jgi:hypothetical protein
MGRLTLNVLLSFAQFEREVIGERIRDKIAASKQKAMWMGGVPPLGYRARDRNLVTVDSEAEIVRSIFCCYASPPRRRRGTQHYDNRRVVGAALLGGNRSRAPSRTTLRPACSCATVSGKIVANLATRTISTMAAIGVGFRKKSHAVTSNALASTTGIR